MTLTYLSFVRVETDGAIIALLQSKGWIQNEPPAYDPATHHAPTWNGSIWVVVALTQQELDAIAAGVLSAKADTIWERIRTALANETEPDFSGINLTNFPLATRGWSNGRFALDSRVDNVVNAAQAHAADNDAHNLSAQLAGKSDTGHAHPVADITGLATVLASLGATYRTIGVAGGSHIAGRVAGTYFLPRGEALGITGTGTLYPPALIPIVAADYPTIGGVAPKLRIRVTLSTNDVAPTGNYTFGLHPVTRPATSGGAGLCIYTVGAAVAGSTVAVNTPAADSMLSVATADFSLPADGVYVVGMVSSGTVANNALVQVNALVQLHNA